MPTTIDNNPAKFVPEIVSPQMKYPLKKANELVIADVTKKIVIKEGEFE
jgi:hypothetical protein